MDGMKNVCKTGWVKLWHPGGVLVTLPVDSEPIDYASMFAGVTSALAAGWLPMAPGLEAGEIVEEVTGVIRRCKTNADGSETPVLDLYSADTSKHFAVGSAYLNNDEAVDEFELVSGLKLHSIQCYVGSGKIELGKNKAADRLLARSSRPFKAVFKNNPKYNPTETDTTKKKPKLLFVRWIAAVSEPDSPKSLWLKWVAAKPSLDSVNKNIGDLASVAPEDKKACWDAMLQYAKSNGWAFHEAAKAFSKT